MIRVKDLTVNFGQFKALDRVSMTVIKGTIHALAGENGSGKSTLLKVLGGAQMPSDGTIVLDGKPIIFSDPKQADKSGVGLIFQELSLFPHLSAVSNIFIGKEKSTKLGLLRSKFMFNEVVNLFLELGFQCPDLKCPVADLSVAEQQVVEIIKCLSRNPKIILFDEPTASLTQREIIPVLENIRKLRAQGYTVVFVSHYLEEVFAIADHITVLRDGHITLDADIKEISQDLILESMLGKKINEFYPKKNLKNFDDVGINVQEAACNGIKPVSLEVKKGEILGVAGSIGSGSELFAKMLGGIVPIKKGKISLLGKRYTPNNVSEALQSGVAYVPEDRRSDALLQDLSVSSNMTLPLIASRKNPLVNILGFINKKLETKLVRDAISQMNIHPNNGLIAVKSLSGGNQQKIVLGRWFLYRRNFLILNNPTKGVDVGSKKDIYNKIMELANTGITIVLVSNYNPELIGMAHRIIVFRDGRMMKSYKKGEATEELLLKDTLGGGLKI